MATRAQSEDVALTILSQSGTATNPVSTTIGDLPSTSQTFTLPVACNLLITMSDTMQANNTATLQEFLNVDGSDVTPGMQQMGGNATNQIQTISRTYKVALAAGSHTIKIRGVASTASATVSNNPTWVALVVAQ